MEDKFDKFYAEWKSIQVETDRILRRVFIGWGVCVVLFIVCYIVEHFIL